MSYFEQQLNSDDTVGELQQLLTSISGWLEVNGFQNKKISERFNRIHEKLDQKQRNILFLAEFSRGKTELINATIFGSTGRRFLPSTPGRTTRCTTVLQYDTDELPSIRLLPTLGSPETQRQPISLLKQNSTYWKRTLFAASDTESLVESLQQIAEVEMVSPEMARDLGFLQSMEDNQLQGIDLVNGKIAVPKYRHAIINYPHPLLKQGLSIIDTPGLNALGIEPELTLRSLESANAIVFVVAADTGVTRSELEAWNQYVKHGNADNTLVVVNKIDTLWDELSSQEEINLQIKKQVVDVARILEIPTHRVFAVSAQKSLVARKNNDHTLNLASGMNKFEEALADTINHSNRKGMVESARRDVSSTLNAVKRVIEQRVDSTRLQISDISQQKENQHRITDSNVLKVRKEREQLEKVSQELDLFRINMRMDYENFVSKLDVYALDKLIARYRFEISNQLTSTGLQREMNQFQQEAVDKFKDSLAYITNLENKVIQLYKTVEQIFESKGLTPRKIHPGIYLDALTKYTQKHDQYSKGLTMMVTEQHALRDRYHASVMVKMRKLYVQTRDEIELWCRTVLIPLELELKEKSSQLKKRLLSFERVRTEDSVISDELNVLQSRLQAHQQRGVTIQHFLDRLEQISNYKEPSVSNVIDLHSRSAAS